MPTTVRGIAIRPTVSRNGREYTTEMLRKAHARLSARLGEAGGMPVTMRTFHPDSANGTGASVEAIAGHVTAVSLTADGAIAYEAELADTPAGQSVAKLTTPDGAGRQHLNGVSIRGYLLGETRKTDAGNTTADDLEICGLDFTDNPGVDGATATAAAEAAAAEAAESRTLIFESVENAIVDNTPAPAKPAVETSPTLDALAATIREAYASLSVDNGPADMRISGYWVDPADLPALVGKIAQASLAALKVLDPDNDGDIDGIAAGDGGLVVIPEAAPAAPTTETASAAPAPERTAPMAESTTAAEAAPTAEAKPVDEAASAAAPAALTAVDVASIVAEALKAAGVVAETAPAGEVTETAEAKAVRESAEAKEALKAEIIAEMRADGVGTRKGLARAADEGFDFAALEPADQEQMAKDGLVALLAPHLADQQ